MALESIEKANIPWTNSRYVYYGILLFWLVINLIQSKYTELMHDEAYYYYYSKVLAWGYFDHPPMIALFIKVGTFFAADELGVRLVLCLSSVLAFAMFIRIAEVKNYFLFFVLWFSLFIVQVGGFLAVPDVPLIFFTAVSILAYKKYLADDNWKNVILLSLAVAALLYSKYTGILVVFFTILSNLKLLKKKSFWLVILLTAILMIPHLFWQIQHDFVTIKYHMVERGIDNYFKWKYVFDYILGQIGILNPLIAFFLLYFGSTFKPGNEFQRALKYIVFGIFLFGLLWSFKGPVEANWTSPAVVLLLVVAFQGIQERKKATRAIYILAAVSALLILPLRGLLMVNYLPDNFNHKLKKEFHDWDKWANELKEKAGDKPVIFVNSYQRAAKYLAYANEDAFSFTTIKYRKSQFDVNGVEKELQGKEVFFCHEAKFVRINEETVFPIPDIDSLETSTRKRVYFTTIKNFYSYNYLNFDFELEDNEFEPGSTIEIPVIIENSTGEPVTVKADSLGTFITVAIYQRGQVLSCQEVKEITGLTFPEIYNTTLLVQMPEIKGDYYLRIAIRTAWLPPGYNSSVKTFKIK